MSVTLDLLKSGSVTLDANGAGSLTFGPERGGESWRVTRINLTCTSTLQTKCNVYRNVVSTLTNLFGSKAGNSDVASGDPPLDVTTNSRFIVVWTSGTPGAIATAVIEGKLTR